MLRATTRWFARVAATRWAEWSEPVCSCTTEHDDLLEALGAFERLLGRRRELLRVERYPEQPARAIDAPVDESEAEAPRRPGTWWIVDETDDTLVSAPPPAIAESVAAALRAERQRVRLADLSDEAIAKRAPLGPADLVDALGGAVRSERGEARPARSWRAKGGAA